MVYGLQRVQSNKFIRGVGSHLELCHYNAIMSQYSQNNAWNVKSHASNCMTNNNNKNNGFRVRAFADCKLLDDERFCVFCNNFLVAYYECRKKKRSSPSEIYYEMNGVSNTLHLALDVYTYNYVIKPSICFIIYIPTIREVFAANFADRVCHVWVAMRLEPMLEKYLPDAINANRRGKGTSGAVRLCHRMIQKGGWIWKFDIQGFFMAIDKRLLWARLEPFAEQYKGWEKPWFMYVLKMTVFNCPQYNCIRVCHPRCWDRLAKNKSLFNNDKWHGLPIGDLLSQMLVGFYIAPFIMTMIGMGYDVSNYVDDTAARNDSKERILHDIPFFRQILKERFQLVLHPKKFYLQHSSKGVTFLGSIIKPNRIYCGHQTIKNAFKKELPKGLKKARASINSYLGYMGQYCTYKLRRMLANRCFLKYGNKIYFGKSYRKMVIKKRKSHRISLSRK